MLIDLTVLPFLWLQIIAFSFGIIIGSFLNVYIYRFNTGKSLSGYSHCLSCGRRLTWYELFPLFSYMALLGRCRTCGSAVPSRYFLVELLTGVLFTFSLFITTDPISLLLLWIIMSLLVVITVYDLYHFIIPDRLTVYLTLCVLVWNFYPISAIDWLMFGKLLFYACACSGFFFLLWFFTKGRGLGFGDVKLAFPLALLVGTSAIFSFVVFSFWIGAVVSLLMMTYMRLRRGKVPLHLSSTTLTMKSAVPFAPFMIAGCLFVLFSHCDVLKLFSF